MQDSAYLIGTDEAGYGPNLGPLVISATVWQVPATCGADGLYRLLSGVVSPSAAEAARDKSAGPCVVIADSKALYQSRKGLAGLERGLLAALAATGRRPKCWREAWEALAPASLAISRAVPWYAGFERPLPVDADPAEIDRLAERLCAGFSAAGVRLVAIRSRAVFEEEFNRLVDQHKSKGAALSRVTLGLVADICQEIPAGRISIVCDKHGGRNSYAPLLSSVFPDALVEIYGEGRVESLYRFGPAERRIEIRFRAKAESHLPAALASMASKYLRELAMLAFNAFWSARVPGLEPTAGYPTDARRFKDAITAAQVELGIEDRVLWRCR